jgi:hypothetical protein
MLLPTLEDLQPDGRVFGVSRKGAAVPVDSLRDSASQSGSQPLAASGSSRALLDTTTWNFCDPGALSRA